ncbi:neuromedin-B-like [Corythoichthys intestinalis]|uniref:neuromedin-B-like n=1 Tax=Corythoichthys intestinalis TaxID=161448 RepID=UPI0025A57FC7|nr:neuromedin-B-like [Corythoichthys intestinalis]XP_061796048.1 neuromedin-B-like [Nerophis lumbriciformis]
MKGLTVNDMCQCGFLTYFLIFSLTSVSTAVSFDLTELRNKVAKINVHPRGNLWATGHFMGKKSVMDTPLLSSAEDQELGALEDSQPQGPTGLKKLFQDFLRVAIQAQMDSQESHLKSQEAEMLMRILEIYKQRK